MLHINVQQRVQILLLRAAQVREWAHDKATWRPEANVEDAGLRLHPTSTLVGGLFILMHRDER